MQSVNGSLEKKALWTSVSVSVGTAEILSMLEASEIILAMYKLFFSLHGKSGKYYVELCKPSSGI